MVDFDPVTFVVVLILLVAFAAAIIIGASANSKRSAEAEAKSKREREEEALRRQMFRQKVSSLRSQYGKITLEIPLQGAAVDWDDFTRRLLFFEESKVVYIDSRPVPFNKILGCTLTDNEQTISTTTGVEDTTVSTGSMIGRAIVGNMVAGRTGAILGASTASREKVVNTTTNHSVVHDYVLFLNVDDLTAPQYILKFGKDMESANEAASAFNVIVHRNHSSHN